MRARRDGWLAVLVALLTLAAVLAYVGPSWSVAGLHYGRERADAAPAPVVDEVRTPTPSASAAAAPPTGETATATTTAPAPTTVAATTTTVPAGRATARPGWVAAENAREGSDGWRITQRDPFGWVEGYARTTSVRPGTPLELRVDTASPSYTVEAYRMGWYGGRRGRLVWASDPQPGVRQPPPIVDPATGLAEARWSVTTTVPVGADWPPGAYLLKLVSSAGGSSYVPVTVRDDTARADLLIVDSVATWQAYNPWGGCSLYACPGLKAVPRAVRVSFDRPYARTYNDGSADFLDHELPVIALAEELGLDVAYATSLDLHEEPDLAARYRGVVSTGHDEYYSRRMRDSLVNARDRGVNLAFLGANAVYRHIRFEPAGDGTPDRILVNHRDGRDPIVATDPGEATIEWRKQGAPEAALVGIQYLCAGVSADLVVADAGHWVWAGTGLADGQVLPGLIGNEADGVAAGSSPANLDRLASSPIRCNGGAQTAVTSYYSHPSGAGVFASGTIWWVCALDTGLCTEPVVQGPVRAATANVLRAFAAGPAGTAHPSKGRAP